MIPSTSFLYYLQEIAIQVDAAETLEEAQQAVNAAVLKYVDLITESVYGPAN